MKVQVADIRWDRDEGRVAFKSVEEDGEFGLGKFSRDRLYV